MDLTWSDHKVSDLNKPSELQGQQRNSVTSVSQFPGRLKTHELLNLPKKRNINPQHRNTNQLCSIATYLEEVSE